MIDDTHICLIESNDGPAPARCDLGVTEDSDFVQVPLRLPSRTEILAMILLLVFLATPACILFFSLIRESFGNTLFAVMVATSIWLLSVGLTTAYWLIWPIGQLKPDHLLRYDKRSETISLNGGAYLFRRKEVLCLLSVTDLRKRKRRTELQLLAGPSNHPEAIFLFDCQASDPVEGFGAIAIPLQKLAGLPVLFATIQLDGTITRFTL